LVKLSRAGIARLRMRIFEAGIPLRMGNAKSIARIIRKKG